MEDTYMVFELEKDGTILRSDTESELYSKSDLEGRNFFDVVGDIDDISELQNHFKSFVKSRKAIESFRLKCSHCEHDVDSRVMMTKTYPTGSSIGAVILEITKHSIRDHNKGGEYGKSRDTIH